METIVRKNSDDIYLMELSGSLDLYSSNQLKELIMKLIESKIERLIIDLKNVDTINSAGMGALIYTSSTFRKMNCPLIIIAPEGPVLQVLELTKLEKYFTVVSSQKEAFALTGASAGGPAKH